MKHRLATAVALTALAAPGAAHAAPTPPKLPAATYKSIHSEVLIPMDDGVKLGATLTFPSKDGKTPAPGRFGVVLSMTPYGRNSLGGAPPGDLFATRGMISAVADVRGTGGSGGTLADNYFSPREARDTATAIEWLASQPYSTGKIGMAGGSYVGITQLLAAEQQPPHLAAITPQVPISDLYRDGFAHGGVPNLDFDVQYIGVQGAPGALGSNDDPSLLAATLAAKLGQTPPGSIAFDYLKRPLDDDFYRARSPIYNAAKIRVPVLILGGWRDGLLRGTTEMYAALAKRKGVVTRLYVDPCTHKGCGAPFAPLTNPPGLQDVSAVAFEFLSHYLLGTPLPQRPPVEVYVQGAGKYADAQSWPPAGTHDEKYDLGDGTLAIGKPAAANATKSYVTNPLAGFSMAFDRFGTVAITPYIPTDQRLEGPQGATFRTAPLSTPLRLTGPIALHLVASSSANETDWHAKLADVAPDGSETIITDGALRGSHRALDPSKTRPDRPYHTDTDPQPLVPGQSYAFDVEIWPTAYELAAGHRLQLRVTSTDLPTHLPGDFYIDLANPLDTRIALNPIATNTIRLADSWLLLPVAGDSAQLLPKSCVSRRRFTLHLRGRHLRSARVTVDGKRVPVRRKNGRYYAVIDLRGRPKGRAVVHVTARTSDGRVVRDRHVYKTCS